METQVNLFPLFQNNEEHGLKHRASISFRRNAFTEMFSI
jgi:hypothetical protein